MKRALALSILPAVSACAAPAGDYPSLLPRPIERISLAEPVRPMPVAAPDPALDARIRSVIAALDGAVRQFDDAVAQARPAIRGASGAAQGSDKWLAAQVALARLDVARTGIDTPLADLERLAIDRAAAGKPSYPALDAATDRAAKAAARQRATIASLSATLR